MSVSEQEELTSEASSVERAGPGQGSMPAGWAGEGSREAAGTRCATCGGSEKVGTGTPSGEGGEDYDRCPDCETTAAYPTARAAFIDCEGGVLAAVRAILAWADVKPSGTAVLYAEYVDELREAVERYDRVSAGRCGICRRSLPPGTICTPCCEGHVPHAECIGHRGCSGCAAFVPPVNPLTTEAP